MKPTTTLLVLIFLIIASFKNANCQQHYVLDKTFGETCGISSIPNDANIFEIFKTQEGKYIVVGEYYLNTANAFYITLAGFTEDGKIDSSFGNNGIVTQTFNQRNGVKSAAFKNNKIYVVGSEAPSNAGSSSRAYIARFKTDGSPDSTFNGNGRVVELTSTNPVSSSIYTHVAIQDDGKVIAYGNESGNINGGNTIAIARRYLSDGAVDALFHPAITYPDITIGDGIYNSPGVIAADGSIKFIFKNYLNNKITIIKLNGNGELDNNFGVNGLNESILDANNDIIRYFSDTDGSMFTQTQASNANIDLRISKFKVNGEIDSTFSEDGFIDMVDYPGTNLNEKGYIVHKDSQNRIWAMGSGSFAFGEPKGLIYRLNDNGSYDTTFEGIGYRAFLQTSGTTFRSAYFEGDNEIVINTNTNGQISLIKLKLIDEVITIQNSGTDTICEFEQTSLALENLSSCYNYQWKKDGIEIGFLNDSTLIVSETGIYTVEAEDGVDTLVSNEINITVEFCEGIEEVFSPNYHIVSPNPFSNSIKITNGNGTEYFQLINSLGEIIYSGKNISEHNFSNIANGFYFLQITDGSKRQVSKIVKM
jgi:uncharacterized delta-60 repeat protein